MLKLEEKLTVNLLPHKLLVPLLLLLLFGHLISLLQTVVIQEQFQLCRGKEPIALSVDHKPNRDHEYARIEAAGGKEIQWNGHHVVGVLAMSRFIELEESPLFVHPFRMLACIFRKEAFFLSLDNNGLSQSLYFRRCNSIYEKIDQDDIVRVDC